MYMEEDRPVYKRRDTVTGRPLRGSMGGNPLNKQRPSEEELDDYMLEGCEE